MRSSLDDADLPAWRAHVNYSPVAAAALIRAYFAIASGPNLVANYLRAANDVTPCLSLRMAPPQLLRMYFIEARAYTAAERGTEALGWVERAIDLAIEIDDQSALAALLLLRGSLNAAMLHYAEGADDYHDSCAMLRASTQGQQGHVNNSASAESELHLTIMQANLRFFMGEYEAAIGLVAEAHGLAALCPSAKRERATIMWVEANLFRWRGQPERALRLALAAAETYSESGPASSAARVQTVTADVALDLAAATNPGSDRDAFLHLARPHIAIALSEVDRTNDEAGAALARLSEVRYLRVVERVADRLKTLERLRRTAERLKDDALLGQVFTGIGDELVARGEEEAALSCYRQAVDILDASEVKALRVWAWRALHRLGAALTNEP